MKKGIIGFATFGLALSLPGSLCAAPITYNYFRTIDVSVATSASILRLTTATAGPNGSIYFTDNGSDQIGFILDPVTATNTLGAAGVQIVGISGGGFSSGNSFRGITYDGTDVYAGGLDGAAVSQLIKVTGVATNGPWTLTPITLPATAFSGFSAVGTAKLAAATAGTGDMNILTVAGAAATVDGTTVGGGARTNQVVADIAHSKIFTSIASDSNSGPVGVFTSNGTTGGTSFSAGANPVVASTASSLLLSGTGLNYENISVNSTEQILCLGRNVGTAGTAQNVWQLYNTAAGGTNLTPYQTIDGSTTPEGVLGTASTALGSVFFTSGGVKYLALGRSTGKVYIFRDPVTASVDSWEAFN